MSLIKSISGIRGTIGGPSDEGLNPLSISKFVIAYTEEIRQKSGAKRPRIVVGRDARISGEMVLHIVKGTLIAVGCDCIDIGMSTTPTTEMAVPGYDADGGIIITASHNPKHWNALKLLDRNGEFLDKNAGERVLAFAENLENYQFASVEDLGICHQTESYLQQHIDAILRLPEVDVQAIREAGFKVAFDSINSVGGIALPPLLKQLGVAEIHAIHDKPTGDFAHNPEPLPRHLGDLANLVRTSGCDVGISVDPDVDRLVLYDEKGEPFGEEYTLVAISDYMLSYHGGGNTVSNLSSTRALRDITKRYGGDYVAAAVGEVNVVGRMKETNALIGGEGNGGIILPKLHYGRDSLVGIALFLSYLAKEKCTVSELRMRYPDYKMSKERVELSQPVDFSLLSGELESLFEGADINHEDGIKFDFPEYWIHIRPSNTEPILRIYTEASTEAVASRIASEAKEKIISLLQKK